MNRVYRDKMDCVRLSAAGKQSMIAGLVAEEQKTAPRPRRVLRTGLVAAVIVGLLTVATGAALLTVPILRNYFVENAQYIYQKNSQILNLSQTVGGWTMTLTDCIGENQFLYVGMEVTAPEGTVLDDTGSGSAGLGVKDMQEKGFRSGYDIMDDSIAVESGTAHQMASYINQIPDGNEADNHLSFVMWVNCREPLDGKMIALTFGNIFHTLPGPYGIEVSDFDGSWHFDNIKLDLMDQPVQLKPNLPVSVLDTTATLTELSVSPISVKVRFKGAGLIGQQQRYPNSYNIADPTIVLYDKRGKVMQLARDRAPFGNRAQSGCDNETGKLWIVESYETLIDLDALDHIEVCGVSIPIE